LDDRKNKLKKFAKEYLARNTSGLVYFALFLTFLPITTSANQQFECAGEVLEAQSKPEFGGRLEYINKERISISISSDAIEIKGTGILFPIPNFANKRWSVLDICSTTEAELFFNNFGCNFDDNVALPSIQITEGSFNKLTAQLKLAQYQKYKVKSSISATELKIGRFDCKEP
jgi:hypothetical protein